ncbi:polysaccharide lyase 6 family protein (plasmid) [Streptomyces sp. BI20]|uniref:polysaccharide lyase 6 family protein n=1 Tax=Streptomyces sp. BI20 TaxID=3403460 RepID=UPI003C7606F8
MRRRTFLTGALVGATAGLPLAGGAFAAVPETPVSTAAALRTALASAGPGTRIVLENGTYAAPAGGFSLAGRSGTADAPITVVARTRGGATITGGAGFDLADASHVVLSGLRLRHSQTLVVPASAVGIRLTRNDISLVDTTDVDWVTVWADGVKIDRNHFHDRVTRGCFLVVAGPTPTTVARGTQIMRNRFSGHGFVGDNGGEPIRLGDSARALSDSAAVIEYNLLEGCDGDPEGISVKASGAVVRYNTIRDSLGGIVLRHGNGNRVEGNHLLGGGNGIRVYGNDHVVVNNHLAGLTERGLVVGSGTVRDHTDGESATSRRGNDACDRVVIAHNTVVNTVKPLSGETRAFEPREVTITDNLLVAASGSLVSMGATTGFTWAGNLFWGAAADGNAPAAGFRRVDPKLAAGADGVFRLTAGSPAIGAAVGTAVSVTEDVDGQPRGSARDVGSDQYSAAAPLRRPLLPADVGPNAS